MTTLVHNRVAFHNYSIGETFIAGIVLQGTEVKALRAGHGDLRDAYISIDLSGEAWLKNMYIPPYSQGNRFNHEERRDRKILLKRKEIEKLGQLIQKKGMTAIPLEIFLIKHLIKVKIGLGKGKKLADKKQSLKEKAMDRDTDRILKGRGR